jgi:putative tryptophan/tyrosine transport system substrate-binding protein
VTGSIPIVFGVVSDPIAAGLVATLTRPGANVTGVTPDNPELSAKRLSLLKEAVPAATSMAALINPDFPATANMVSETRRAATELRVGLQVVEARQPAELAKAFDTMTRAKVKGLVVLPDPMFIAHAPRIAELATTSRIPGMFHSRGFVETGALSHMGRSTRRCFSKAPYCWTRS